MEIQPAPCFLARLFSTNSNLDPSATEIPPGPHSSASFFKTFSFWREAMCLTLIDKGKELVCVARFARVDGVESLC